MNEDLNPKLPSDPPQDALAKALDELMEGRSSFAEAAREDMASVPGAEGGCPEPGEWLVLVSGKARPDDAAETTKVDALLAHAALCRTCAERLRLLSVDASPQEIAEVGKLASASRDWQDNFAAELARTPRQNHHWLPRKRVSQFYIWAGAGLAASLLIGAVLTEWWQRAN